MSGAKPIIGVAGGIGSGKSTVASILGELGAGIIGSDRLNHEELNTPEVLSCLRQWWGDAVITPEGRADRDALRAIVAADPSERMRLEGLVHPRIARRSRDLMQAYKADPSVLAIVWDAPLLYEVGLADQCDDVIFVEAAEAVRRQRVLEERGWTDAEFERLERMQTPLAVKQGKANYTVTNNADLADLRRQVQDVFSRILSAG